MSSTEVPQAVEVRDLTIEDLPALMQIERAAFTMPWREATFESLLRRSDTDMVAVTVGDRLAGYAVCWTILDQAELGNVAVSPDHRGRGIGRLLVQSALQRVRARGAAECYLEVRESNRVARRLYEQFGFGAIGTRRRYYSNPTEDALVMRVRLRDAADNRTR